ncbi:hypothetical protein NVP1069O_02 [Vibrio phage 1.069.O._10N.286.49.F11]|uniref:Uncharacterized protein n=7 Tax=Autolykiviridae TaxID=2184034 RepID=A0A2I7S832_9VIRU|nr:hypothetical protein KMD65_gp02 [Vibrio phage 1.008.O._10N.286.54.E5]AUR81631.1 hypothetical protein NVP1011O_02 [Vibrio phage 1.011.O._10N.286.49.B11]AUR83769.1 hypothetical protein NVP1040O_02 [Vibrio phage 1.040.O._10N.286.45.B9]AUR84648.1 hypothetical protein NVP1062O_02 [Vibrio phage 1.062.O._10N.286.55.C3]AUR85145.1 hypothetical protein NVP1069O_02 [Vibrio phage 1.069.O._10N.286.49.F11]AUR89573.1 hypothetical protein NVP1125O_02 [Vibrio phage 1.125.O._10N.286.49.F5]AUS02062.1 hypothe
MARYVKSKLTGVLYLITNYMEDDADDIIEYMHDQWGDHYELDPVPLPHEGGVKLYWCQVRQSLIHLKE